MASIDEASSKNAKEAAILASYTGKTVLVTGGNGFIGSTLIHSLSRVSCQIILLLRPGRTWEVKKGSKAEVTVVDGDILEQKTWRNALAGVDYVFHFAAQTSARVADENPQADVRANVTPLLQMLNACRAGGLKPAIMFAGTTTQVGLPKSNPVNETAADHPITAYDVNKLAGEKHLQIFTSETGAATVTLRLANVYGPGVNVGSRDRGFLNLMIKNAFNNHPLTVYGDGNHIRDYIFIDDVVSAFLTAGQAAAAVSGRYYVVGKGQGTRIRDAVNLVADRVQAAVGYRPEVQHVPNPSGLGAIEDRDFIADSGLFRATTGWDPKVSLEIGIDRTIEFFMKATL